MNVFLAAVITVLAVLVTLVLLLKTWQTGAGLDAGWGGFLLFLVGFVARAAFQHGKDSSDGTDTTPNPPAPSEGQHE